MYLLGMRSDDDWNLLAMYNEPFRLHNVACNQLWQAIHTPYYQALEPAEVNGYTRNTRNPSSMAAIWACMP